MPRSTSMLASVSGTLSPFLSMKNVVLSKAGVMKMPPSRPSAALQARVVGALPGAKETACSSESR